MKVIWLFSALIHTSLLATLQGECRPSKAPVSNSVLPPLLDATLDELREGLDSGLFTSVDLVTAYLARIEEVNSELRAVTETNPDALSIAAKLDTERIQAPGAKLGPLHGIPILVKDNIATDDKMNTTAGSYALLGAKVNEDSTVVAKLRRAGAIILGKANMSQWAACRERVGVPGWSAYGGQTIGAYFPRQNPMGSSSGSAVGASIGLAWGALGTDTGGSVTFPAMQNNVVGFRPTVGLTSRYMVIPYSAHMDTVGTLTRTVKDAAHLLSAIAGPDSQDGYTSRIPFETLPDYVGACSISGLRGKRIGVSRNMIELASVLGYDPSTDTLDAALDLMRLAGAEIIDNIFLPGPADAFSTAGPSYPIPDVDFLSNLPDRYLSKLKINPHNINSLTELMEFTKRTPNERYPVHKVDAWQMILGSNLSNTAPEWRSNYSSLVYDLGTRGLTGALANYSLDAMVSFGSEAALLSASLGTPVVTVPLGRLQDGEPVVEGVGGLVNSAPNKPFGISFSGLAFSEETLFSMAYAFEQMTQVRKSVHPIVTPKTELKDVVGRK